MRNRYLLTLLCALLFAALALHPLSALTPTPQTQTTAFSNSYTQFTGWLPVIFAAILLAFAMVSLYYLIGVALNNPRVKGMAMSEFWQVVGTAVMVIAILWIFGIFGSTLTSTSTLLISPNYIEQVCNAPALANSQFEFTNSTYEYAGTTPSPTNNVCTNLIDVEASGNGNMNTNLDYGLAAAFVIDANMTNQTLANLDALYFLEGTSGWLRSFKALTVFCVGEPIPPAEGFASALECANPLNGDNLVKFEYSYQPYIAYYFQRVALPPVEITASLIFYLFFLQMVMTLIMLYWWPYLLAAGILLRTFSWTRRAGGLVIAIVVVTMLIYPIVYLFEYTSLGNGTQLCQYNRMGLLPGQGNPAPATVANTGNCVELIGANSLPNMVIHELPLSYPGPYNSANPVVTTVTQGTPAPASSVCYKACIGQGAPTPPPTPTPTFTQQPQQYQVNFYVFPNLAWVLNYYGCYPDSQNLLAMELLYSANYLIPLNSLVASAESGIGGFFQSIWGGISGSATPSNIPNPWTPITGGQQTNYNCFLPQNLSAVDEQIFHVYGVMSVTGFIIPLLNVLIALSAILGLSGLLGGDTNIVGLGRFI